MLNILSRRAPYVRLLLFPCKVQGDGAAEDIAATIAHANEVSGHSVPRIDTLIVGRGGGSLEDLWAFNEETVARAIAASAIPIISAVGHETDTTIADFVADLRAPTPSAAAERVAREQTEIESFLTGASQWMRQRLSSNLDRLKDRVKILGLSRLFDMPRQRILEEQQRLDLIAATLTQSATQSVRAKIQRIEILRETVARHRPDQQIAARRQHIQSNHDTLLRTALHRLETLRHQLSGKEALLKVLSPDSTMERGFSITLGQDGKVIRTPEDAPRGTNLRTVLKNGEIQSTVT
jgi:exodeoxyribonuclease VII large subunit